MMQVCESRSIAEWISVESLDYIAECLECCTSSAMVRDLRQIFPREALLAATKHVSPAQRDRLRYWVVELNQQVAA